jgi:hypothetical protein
MMKSKSGDVEKEGGVKGQRVGTDLTEKKNEKMKRKEMVEDECITSLAFWQRLRADK